MHGRDLTPLIMNPEKGWRYPAFMTATGQTYGSDTNNIPKGDGAMHNQVPWYVLLRDERYKYVRPLIEDLEELYDLQNDPDELDNLAVKRQHQDLLKKMRAAAIVELRRTKAGFVDRMPAVKELVG